MADQPVASQEAPAIADTSELSIDDARKMLDASTFDDEGNPVASADDATTEQKLSVEGNADPETDPGETEEAEAAKEPPIERPKSWSKDEDAEWQSLPRTVQQKIVARESERDAGTVRSQQKAAEAAKAAEAKAAQAEEARQRYEAKLPEVMQNLVDVNNRDYADIKSQADIDTLIRAMNQLAATDPVQAQQINAYLTGWQLHQQKMAATRAELDQSNQRRATKEQADWADFMGQENAKARELIPELADPVKGPELERRAAAHLANLGFKDDELNALASGKQKLGVYDHRLQVLINDSLKLAELQRSKAEIPAKLAKLPQVQRPGVARPAGQQDAENLKVLEKRLNETGSEKDAWALYEAQLKASSRRAS